MHWNLQKINHKHKTIDSIFFLFPDEKWCGFSIEAWLVRINKRSFHNLWNEWMNEWREIKKKWKEEDEWDEELHHTL